jgi:hypothetical protein
MIAVLSAPVPAAAQSVSAWLELNGAHSRPPSGADIEPANYGLLGGRVRYEGDRSAFEVAATHGRGIDGVDGSWLTGRAALDASRVRGAGDFGVRAEGSGVGYLTPVTFGDDDEYTQTLSLATLRPYAGISIGGLRIGAEAVVAYGTWSAEFTTDDVVNSPLPPLPGRPPAGRTTERDDGALSMYGGGASVLRMFGPATVEVRGGTYHARNQVVDGQYSGVDANVVIALGRLDLSVGGRHWDTPTDGAETGGHAGVGMAFGSGVYLHASAARTVADPVYGSRGSAGGSIGISMRLGRRSLGPPLPAMVGASTATGRRVSFTFKRDDARTVAVAGDFTGWEPRALQRGANGEWTLETVIEPGVYHYSFVVDGHTWIVPPSATGIVDDGFGRKNATLIVRPSGGGDSS